MANSNSMGASAAAALADAATTTSSTASPITKSGRYLKVVRTIKQAWLDEYLNLRLEREALKAKLNEVEGKLEDKSEVLCAYYKYGIRPEKGPLTGEVKVKSGRRQVTKDQIIDVYGKEAYAKLLNDAKRSEDKEYFEVMKRIG